MPRKLFLSLYSFLLSMAILAPLKASDAAATCLPVVMGIRCSSLVILLCNEQSSHYVPRAPFHKHSAVASKMPIPYIHAKHQQRSSRNRDSYARHKGAQQR